MGDEPEVVNRVPEETPKPTVKKTSELVFNLLQFLCFTEVIGKWEALKNTDASFCEKKFKIEQALRPSKVELYFFEESGKLTRAFRAREVFMEWEEKRPGDFAKLVAELKNKEKVMIEPLAYKKKDYEKVCRVRAALGDPEKKYLDTKMTPTEQAVFLRKHELWNDPS